jgi:hypothetical protein
VGDTQNKEEAEGDTEWERQRGIYRGQKMGERRETERIERGVWPAGFIATV